MHRLLAWEERAILELIEEWGWVDRSHSQARAPRLLHGACVRVAVDAFARRIRSRCRASRRSHRPQAAAPEVPWERNRIWIWDASHFPRAGRVAYAIVDVVSRHWIGYLLSIERSSTQAQLLFARALEDQGLVDGAGMPPAAEDGLPVLVAWSDNGAEMTAADTRQFMALMTIAQHHGRPGTPTDQAHLESFFGHLKSDWPHLTAIREPDALDAELARIRDDYNTVRLHAGIGYVTPADEHHGRGPQIRRARAAGLRRARAERIKHNRRKPKR